MHICTQVDQLSEDSLWQMRQPSKGMLRFPVDSTVTSEQRTCNCAESEQVCGGVR